MATKGRVTRKSAANAGTRPLDAEELRRMHAALPCRRVMSIDASHSAYFSKPDILTDCLMSVVPNHEEERHERAASAAARV
jgi:hypothetical protein